MLASLLRAGPRRRVRMVNLKRLSCAILRRIGDQRQDILPSATGLMVTRLQRGISGCAQMRNDFRSEKRAGLNRHTYGLSLTTKFSAEQSKNEHNSTQRNQSNELRTSTHRRANTDRNRPDHSSPLDRERCRTAPGENPL